jgi:hypothetical protein
MSAMEALTEVAIARTTLHPAGLLPASPISFWLPQRGMNGSQAFWYIL